MSDIKNVRSFLFEFKDGTELRLVEKENYDKLVERIKELEDRCKSHQKLLYEAAEVEKNSIPKQKVKNRIKENKKLIDETYSEDIIQKLTDENEILEELLEDK